MSDIYDVREVLELMALRILPLPVPPKSLATLEALQRQHSDAIDAAISWPCITTTCSFTARSFRYVAIIV